MRRECNEANEQIYLEKKGKIILIVHVLGG